MFTSWTEYECARYSNRFDRRAVEDEDLIPLSALNQYSYCPRRCYLIHAEGIFEDNVHTIKGTNEHERIDSMQSESKPDSRLEYALPVWSRKLGLIGKCDVVEFRADGTLYPVEHKHGKRKQRSNDDMQLGAQAMCLEEMLGIDVPTGAIYHQQSRRRREVSIDGPLRKQIEMAAHAIRQMLEQLLPPPCTSDERRCRECSLGPQCQPEIDRSRAALASVRAELFEP